MVVKNCAKCQKILDYEIPLGRKKQVEYPAGEFSDGDYVVAKDVFKDDDCKQNNRSVAVDFVFGFGFKVKACKEDVASVKWWKRKNVEYKKPQVYERHVQYDV